jgi:transposase InsO family protein
VVADALSRPAAAAAAGVEWVCAAIANKSPLDLKDMALRQILCPQVQALRSSLGLRIITQKVGDLDLIGDSSTGVFRPLVPRDLRRQVFEHLHGAAHPGRRAPRRLISSRYVWKGLSTDVTAWVKACLGCQRAKVHRHVQVPPQHIPVPSRRFSHIHVDLVGPLPASKGFTYLFTIIDRTSRWPEAIPIAATTTVDCANALFQGWVSRFGVPAVITSDRGAQFTSSLWAALCSLLNIQHNQTTAYHPQSKGMVERFHRRLKDALHARCTAANWVDHLPWVILGLRTAAREDDGSTPAQEVFGSILILPGQFLDSPEIPPKIFLEQFSKTLSAAKHSATRHNTAPARGRSCPTTFSRTDSAREAGRPRTATPAAIQRPLHRRSPLPAPLHAAHRRQGGQGVNPQTQTLHGSYSAARATQGPGPPARRRPLPGFPAARGRVGPPGTLRSTATSRTAPGTVFPWHDARGFCTQFLTTPPLGPPAQIRPLGLRPRGLGGPL